MIDNLRNAQQKAETLLNVFPALAIIGSRQCGKTTLSKQIHPDWMYVDLENPLDFKRITEDPLFFFSQYPHGVIIDEAQKYPPLFEVLRGVIDQNRSQKGRFILTGSSQPELLKNISESLAGRIGTITLSPFKANELARKPLSNFYQLFDEPLNKEKIDLKNWQPVESNLIEKMVFAGGYPEPLLLSDPKSAALWMDEYVKTYIYRDISSLFPGLNKLAYQRFLMMLAELSGTIINKSQVARDIEVSEKSIRDYLMIAEGTFLWRNLPSFEHTSRKALVKMPKGFLCDSGLLCHLLQISNQNTLYLHPKLGRIFEGFVIEEILRGLLASLTTNWQASYYRTRNGAEVDLIISGPFGILPIEIKHGMNINFRHLHALTDFITELNCPFGLLVNQAKEPTWLTERILQLPIAYL